ncbi:S8 family peptidase [Clostridium sp. AF32-12BH]|uniref:S8 family peptidase n=1 Tax=Clostridium sp. AF32-12BH TaxID=2292006 RepID=UPI000E4FC268|nr:S8 family peptidase [Clostridium sp. AF32-12BH]RHP49664.1 peptidase [Clostridium sp. AF32-12BH]
MIPCNISPASEDYADFIVRYSPRAVESLYELTGTQCVNLVSQEYAIVHVPLANVLPLSFTQQTYSAIPKLYGLQDTTALESAGILPVFSQPNLTSTGQGILIGLIDTGIDYTNPLFQNPDGTSRILSIWDQTRQRDFVPEPVAGFQPFYGTVYSREDLNRALASEDPLSVIPPTDTNGHGTFLAGVAAGNQTDTIPFSGAAPDATLAVVRLKPAKQYLRDFFAVSPEADAYQENDIMAGVAFLLGIAGQYQMPLVLCLGAGTSQGSHSGVSPLSIQLQALSGTRGFACVLGAGNETGFGRHYTNQLPQEQKYDDVELRIASPGRSFSMELWADASELYTIGFVSPSGEVIERIPLAVGQETTLSFQLDATRIFVSYQITESVSGRFLAFLRFTDPMPGIWHIRVYPTLYLTGQFHIWLPLQSFLSDDTRFLRPDPDITITDPGNAPLLLTVSTYNHITNSLYIHSSRGFTATGQIKPDLAAPGVDVQGPALQRQASSPPEQRVPAGSFSRSSQLGRSPVSDSGQASPPGQLSLTRRTGSSVAAALTAGAVACLFSWGFTQGNDATLTSISVKSILIRGADRKEAFQYPNRQWGYGTLNLYQSFLLMRE